MKKLLFCFFIFLALLLFIINISSLMQQRFERGDIYPHYSSLRKDPLGCSLFFESLEQLNDLNVQQYFSEPPESRNQRTQFLIGVPLGSFNIVKQAFQSAADGDQVVISFQTHSRISGQDKLAIQREEWMKHFGFEIGLSSHQSEKRIELNQQLYPWYSNLTFQHLTPKWNEELPLNSGNARAIQAKWGQGNIWLYTDSYLFSNECFDQSPPLSYLSQFIPQSSNIIFNEVHHGIESHIGISDLVARYHLQGVVLGVILLALLYIWSCSIPMIPKHASFNKALQSTEHSSQSGLKLLLERSLSSSQALKQCLILAKQHGKRYGPIFRDQLEQEIDKDIKRLDSQNLQEDEIVRLYNHYSQLISKRSP